MYKMIFIVILSFLTIVSTSMAQNASFGMSLGKVLDQSREANQWSADIRYQLAPKSSVSVEVSTAKYTDGKIVTTILEPVFGNQTSITEVEEVDRFTTLSAFYSHRLLVKDGFFVEANLGGGFYMNDTDYFGLLRGGLFFSAKLSDHLVAGIPISYQFVT